MTHHLQSQTMPEFFGARFSSPALRLAAALIIFIFLIPYTASVYNGLSRLFDMAFGIPYEWCIVGMAVLTCVYVVMGGYMATALNDMVQGFIMLIGIVAVIVAVLMSYGGFTQAMLTLSQVPSDAPGMEAMQGAYVSIFGTDLFALAGVLVLTSLGPWGMPQMVQKFYAIKSTDAIKRGAIISTLFAVVIAGGCYFLGGFGRLAAASIEYTATGSPVYDSVVPTMIKEIPDVLMGLVVVLVLSASLSTLSALVLTSSSTMTLDFLKGKFIREMNVKGQLVSIRLFIVAFVLVSMVIALVQYNSPILFIAQLMAISWGVLAGSFLGPFLYGLYWQRTTVASVWACFIFALVLVCGNMILGLAKPGGYAMSPINAGALAMLAGLVIVPLVSWLTPRPDAERTSALFRESYQNLHDAKIDAD
jgi:SSS family solute:Na+ symporter/sodium/proline symporter